MTGTVPGPGKDAAQREVRILHVDDDPALAETTASFLEREDDRLAVETATDAREALARLDRDVDCVVSDYEMPGTDGIEFLERVREDYPELPFILFTGEGSESVASEAISAGVTDYLQKQVGSQQYELLCNRIQNAVERYRTGRRLRRSRRRFQRVFEHTHDGVLILDPRRDEIRSVNDRAAEMLGYDRAQLLSMSPRDVHPHEVERFQRFVESVYEDGTGWTEELSCVRADGERVPVHVSAATVEIDGRDYMLALIRTIDEESGERTERELFRTLLDHSTDGIYVIDPDSGEFEDVNDTACRRLCYDREQLLSMSVPDIDATGTIAD